MQRPWGNRTFFRSNGAPGESVECLPSQATGVGEINAFNGLFPTLSAVLVEMVYKVARFAITFCWTLCINKLIILLLLAFLIPSRNVKFFSSAWYALLNRILNNLAHYIVRFIDFAYFRSGELSVSWSRMFLKSGQVALRKLHLFSGIVCVGWTWFIGERAMGGVVSAEKGPAQVGKAGGRPG